MKKSIIRVVQKQLNAAGYDSGPDDGILGPGTMAALEKALEKSADELHENWLSWSKKRKVVAYIQLLCKKLEIETGAVDGYWGPQTDYAYEVFVYYLEQGQMPQPWRDFQPLNVNPNEWPSQSEAALIRFYGNVGENQARVQLPYTHRLAWNKVKKVNAFSCHEKVSDSLGRVLERVLDHYGEEGIKELGLDLWGGCLNVRKKRGGSSWSTHAWGIALDYDPANNKLNWGRDRAAFAQPVYETWWRLWEEEGWVSLGRTSNFDWMHVQAAKR